MLIREPQWSSRPPFHVRRHEISIQFEHLLIKPLLENSSTVPPLVSQPGFKMTKKTCRQTLDPGGFKLSQSLVLPVLWFVYQEDIPVAGGSEH
jgi:hypothetical protein